MRVPYPQRQMYGARMCQEWALVMRISGCFAMASFAQRQNAGPWPCSVSSSSSLTACTHAALDFNGHPSGPGLPGYVGI